MTQKQITTLSRKLMRAADDVELVVRKLEQDGNNSEEVKTGRKIALDGLFKLDNILDRSNDA